ncbi:MAG: AAA family ATPase [Calditrichaeota bacterium]|jgi:hypothetical protein|nr:AAA family ATPase [Calditrichota bacterium]
MARLYYKAMTGVGGWEQAIKQAGVQIRPYRDYLKTAIKSAERRSPTLSWRVADSGEVKQFKSRLETNTDQRRYTFTKRNQQHLTEGFWIVLETLPGRDNEPDQTFNVFLHSKRIYEHPFCRAESSIDVLRTDSEGQALLIDRLPEIVIERYSKNPIPQVWLKPDNGNLKKQDFAINNLENRPTSKLEPLIRLFTKFGEWPEIKEELIEEDEWMFLKPGSDSEPLRKGTDEQRRFVSIALATPDFALLEGPPGSGKTTAICELILQTLKRDQRILLVASTHVAVDNVLERIIEFQEETKSNLALPVRIGLEDRITSDILTDYHLDNLERTWKVKISKSLDRNIPNDGKGSNARKILRDALRRQSEGIDNPLIRLLLDSSNLICGTTIGILQHPGIRAQRYGESIGFEPFDLMIIDEASKTTFPEFLVPAMYANKWIVVGDVKQLSPYVEELDLADNIEGLVQPEQAKASYVVSSAENRWDFNQFGGGIATVDNEIRPLWESELQKRSVANIDLDSVKTIEMNGISGCIPELLYCDVVIGSPDSLRKYQKRLPSDLRLFSDKSTELIDWEASHQAYISSIKNRNNQDTETTWASEIAWRLIRSFELRQNPGEKDKYNKGINSLIPLCLDESWFKFRHIRQKNEEESAKEYFLKELKTIQRVAMPSILELLQHGYERLPDKDFGVPITDGLPDPCKEQRKVSLSYQHRMHPEISIFPREQFYINGDNSNSPDIELLRDSEALNENRKWDYNRYLSRATWINVPPKRSKNVNYSNSNIAESDIVVKELKEFVKWASQNPKRQSGGSVVPWEVAILTFYTGQEKLLREKLKSLTGQNGNRRNFWLPKNKRTIKITLCTVDRFQGHEADIVFLSFVKHNTVGFLNSPNRLNVGLTRARFQLVLIGYRSFFGDRTKCKSTLLNSLANSQFYNDNIGWS